MKMTWVVWKGLLQLLGHFGMLAKMMNHFGSIKIASCHASKLDNHRSSAGYHSATHKAPTHLTSVDNDHCLPVESDIDIDIETGKQEPRRSWIITSLSTPWIRFFLFIAQHELCWDERGWNGKDKMPNLERLNPFGLRWKGALVHIINALSDSIARWTP